MKLPETRYAKTADGVHIAYQTLGDRSPDIIQVGMMLSHVEHQWEAPPIALISRSLAESGRLMLFDGRGSGLSDPLPGDRLPTLEERIDDMRAVMDATASERAVVVSFADGGPLCCFFAATYPDRTRALILCNTHPRTAWAPDYPWGMTPDEFDQELAATEERWGTRAYAAEQVRRSTPETPDDAVMIDWWARLMRLAAPPGAAATLLRMYYDMDVRDLLPTIHVPTLVLSSIELAEESAALASSIPGATHQVTSGRGPLTMADPNAYTAEITAFISKIEGEEADLDRVLATVVFTDIVGATAHAAALGDRDWRALAERHHRFVRGVIARWRGREIDTAGDGFFAAFDGPARSIRAATAIVEGVRSMGIEVRVGIHTGEVETINDKVGGITVIIGARVAALAGPSEVLVSQTVKDLVAGSGLTFEDAGEHELKGVPNSWHIYRVASST
jgi:class 3 adenylate cyclase